ncbi:MAG: hypothetical protein EBT22_06090, partial [Chloroflexi bacterium]|nr:hypothetical protein [Chloroflexota bacterium]
MITMQKSGNTQMWRQSRRDAQRGAEGTDGMNRTKILTWRQDRVPTWMLTVVMATAIALSLMWGVNPAAADTAPASTPTQIFNSISAHVDFKRSEFQLVDESNVPVAASSADVDTIVSLTDTALMPSADREILKNRYSETGSESDAGSGKIDFEAGNLGSGVTVAATSGDVLIGSFYVRVKTNPVSNANYTLTLRAQNAATEGDDQYRNSVIGDGSSVGTAGKNIMGMATNAVLPVKKTTVALSIDPSYTTIGQSLASDRRVGDIIPVDLKLTATTIVRNATSLNAVITFPSADFVLVTSATDAAPVSATTGVGAVINSTGFAFGTGALASAPGAANTFRVASSLPTITLKIDGAALALAANDVKTVGRFYVRPKYNGDTSSATKNLTIAANPSLGIRASDGGSLGFTTTVTGAGDFRVAVAKTTVTLS